MDKPSLLLLTSSSISVIFIGDISLYGNSKNIKLHRPRIRENRRKNTAEFQTQITALEKQLTALKAKAKATIESSSNQDMITALNKLVDMGAIDETERNEAYKKFGIKKPAAPRSDRSSINSPPTCGGFRPSC
jgi:ATPase subunit of ABC transporter with duplicated ATPase domains